jgi:lysyl-tRNA synthetase class 2
MSTARTRSLAAAATALAGVATIASSLSPNAPDRQRLLETLVPGGTQAAAHAVGVVGGLATLWVALEVRHGRRRIGRVALLVLGVLAIVHMVKGLDYEEALLGLAVALGARRALGERSSHVLTASLLVLVACAGAYAGALVYLLASGHAAGLGAAALRTAWGAPALAIAVTGSLLVLLCALFAPAPARDGHDDAEHARASALVAAHGEDSIAPFLLRADKAFHFAAGGALAYRAVRGLAIVAGDPVGPPGCAPHVLASFLDHARERGWDVVVLGAADEHLGDYAALGLRSLQVGVEAVVDPRAFALSAPAAKTVRKAVRRVGRHGWTVEVVSGAGLNRALTADIAACDAAWRRTHPRLYGFAMAGDRLWGAPEDAGDVYVLARDPAGELRAFQRYVRYRRGFSLDATRRLDDEPNGVTDSLVTAMLEHARAEGAEEVSLNFSGFGHLMAADVLERRSHRLARWALRRLHRRFQLERLVRASAKFSPAWRPRHLVYTQRTRLPLAALRILQAEAYLKPPPARRPQDAWVPLPVPLMPAPPTPTLTARR